jgi:uncharacterized membrane protein
MLDHPLPALLRTVAAGFVLSAAAAAAHAQARYAVTDLGVLPGYTSCSATALNDTGGVVGVCSTVSNPNDQMAFSWRAGTLSAVGRLRDGQYSGATGINAQGTLTGVGDTGNFRPQGWVTSPRGLVNFFPNNGGNTLSLFVADAGWIGGYYTKSMGGPVSSWRGAIWTQDAKDPRKFRTANLPVLPGGIDPASVSSLPSAFNQRGQAAGYATNDQIGQHAVFWNADQARSIVDLGTVDGDGTSLAFGLNDLGQVVGSSHPPFGSRAVMWGNDAARTATVLPPLPGDNYGRATAINNAGHTIGVSYYGTPGTWDATPERAVVWRDGTVVDLLAALDGAGPSSLVANDINEGGQIAGSALIGGAWRPVLLTPLN